MKIEIKNETLYFYNAQEKIDYEFIDQVGVFTERFPLKFNEIDNIIKLDLKENFKSNLKNNLKIKFRCNSENDINESLDDINNLYHLKVYTVNEYMYLECILNPNIVRTYIENGRLIVESQFKTMIYCEKKIESTHLASSLYCIGKNETSLDKIIKLIHNHSFNKQQWKISIRITDEDENDTLLPFVLLDFFQSNKKMFENHKIFLNQKYNYLIFDNIENEKNTEVVEIQLQEDYLDLILSRNIEEPYLFIALRSRQGNIFNYDNYKSYKIIGDCVQIQYKDFNDFYLTEKDNIDVLIGNTISRAKFITPSDNIQKRNEYFQLNDNVIGKFYINGRSTLSIYIKTLPKANPYAINVAVLGTCFSRNALNTMYYFNPDYKKYIRCVFTQFHSRLDSLNANPAPQELSQQYEKDNEFNHIKVDLDKTFYEKLYESNAEVLVFDLYSDALLKPIQLVNNSIVTYNYLIKNNNNLGSFVKDWDVNKYLTEEEVLERFKYNLDIFMENVTNIIPENKIILNRGRLAETYMDDDEEIKTFKTINLIKRNNYFWEKIDNIVISNYPNVKIIDLSKKNYLASKSHPFGFSFSHYESEYYKHFLNELIKKLLEITLEP